MTQQKRFFDDVSRLMTNAVGVAQGAKDEAETAFKGWVDRWLAERDFVTREEFEAVREMAIKARTENAELRAMIAGMRGGTAAADSDSSVSEADAPASGGMTAGQPAQDATDPGHVAETEAPASTSAGMKPGDDAASRG